MLSNKRLTIVAETIVDGEKIASYGAILNLDDMDLSFTSRYINKEACKIHKETVRADSNAFEDYAYAVQDKLATLNATEN